MLEQVPCCLFLTQVSDLGFETSGRGLQSKERHSVGRFQLLCRNGVIVDKGIWDGAWGSQEGREENSKSMKIRNRHYETAIIRADMC